MKRILTVLVIGLSLMMGTVSGALARDVLPAECNSYEAAKVGASLSTRWTRECATDHPFFGPDVDREDHSARCRSIL
jgi:hypothetical protein